MVSELLREAFELDSRLIRTLKLLLFRPGALAVEFSNNRRASYVSPIRLYLFVSILFFFFLSIGAEFDTDVDPDRPEVQVQVGLPPLDVASSWCKTADWCTISRR